MDLFGSSLPVVVRPGFEELWAVWCRKVAKKEAIKAYNKAVKDGVTPEFLIHHALRYAASVNHKESSFVLHLATWIRGERWNDQLEAINAPGTSTSSNGRAKGDSRLDDLRGYWLDTSFGDAPGE